MEISVLPAGMRGERGQKGEKGERGDKGGKTGEHLIHAENKHATL